MASFEVTISVDMIKIEDRGAYKSVLWSPFDNDTPLSRVVTTAHNVKELEMQVAALVESYTKEAALRIVATGNKFNGFRIRCMLAKGQRKPSGWNTSKRLRIEHQVEKEI